MVRIAFSAVALSGWLALAAAAPAETGHALGPDAPAERVVLLDNREYRGLVESEDAAWVNLIQFERSGGRLFLVIRPIERSRVASVVRLDEAGRAELRRQIEQFRNRAAIEAGRMENVRLAVEDRDGTPWFRYPGKWFMLGSSLDEETTQQVVVRLEQMFTAYRQVLPPRVESQRALQVAVHGTMAGYRDHLARLGVRFDRPACFVPDGNLVLAGSELSGAAAQLHALKRQHATLQRDLRLLERELTPKLNELGEQLRRAGVAKDEIAHTLARTRQELEKAIASKRTEIQRVDRRNQELFDRAAGQMFAQLYHECFHAYLENYVYPRDRAAAPLWLNEGLAQVFEAAAPQSTSLRVDSPDAAMLKRLKADLAGEGRLPLSRIVAAESTDFLASADAARLYLYSWGLAYYLAFERRAIPSPALDHYVRAEKTAPVIRFERFVDTSLDEFEKRWRKHILELK